MKRSVIYWLQCDRKRKEEVKKALGITSVSVNGESEYKGDVERLKPYVEEGLITIRVKEYEQKIRRKKVCFDTVKSESFDCRKIRQSSGKRKV